MIKMRNIKRSSIIWLTATPCMHELDIAFQNCVSMLSIIIKTRKLEHTRMLKMHNHLGLQIYHVFSCLLSSVVTNHRCIDVSRYLSRDMYRDTVCNNRNTRDLATFLRFLFECHTDINCLSAKNYQCRMSSHPQQTAGSYSQLKSIKLCCMSPSRHQQQMELWLVSCHWAQ